MDWHRQVLTLWGCWPKSPGDRLRMDDAAGMCWMLVRRGLIPEFREWAERDGEGANERTERIFALH